MAPIRLAPIYRLDVLSLLPHSDLRECRLVSRVYNSTIINHPRSLPVRRQLSSVDIAAKVNEPDYGHIARFTRHGYVHHDSLRALSLYKRPIAWQKMPGFQDCCNRDELKALAYELGGQRILPNFPHDVVAEISILPEHEVRREIIYAVRNEMTRETAADLLHLLKHLGDVAIYNLSSLDEYVYDDPVSVSLNPLIPELLSRCGDIGPGGFNLRVIRICPDTDLFRDGIPNLFSYLKLSQLDEYVHHPGAVVDIIPFSTLVGSSIRCISIKTSTIHDLPVDLVVDPIIEAFTTTLPVIGREIVSQLVLSRYYHKSTSWPTQCASKEEMGREEHRVCDKLEIYYRQRLNNINSGEGFDLVMVCKQVPDGEGRVGEVLREVQFKFGP